ncbi:SGNH hydrolase domain-containing protein [Patulibacter sp. NPDC049589]|uniref:SGNH hydrolase domain-containing protein n=1 Tax=Patulibacter sp. NPDC049589 TaxID=3154731 RepID=UPI0034304A15
MRSAAHRPAPLLLVVALLLSLGVSTTSWGSPVDLTPSPHSDAAGDVRGSLDVTSATFGQQDTQLQLSIGTKAPWSAARLALDGPRQLCVEVSAGKGFATRVRICVVPARDRSALDAAPVRPDGTSGPATRIAAVISRPERNAVVAQFPPAAAGLPAGPMRWRVSSRWTDRTACPAAAPCVDHAPDTGYRSGVTGLLVQPRCYGAAARAPGRRCVNPDLRHVAIPTPDDATITPNAFCKLPVVPGVAEPCQFGWLARIERPSVALVGDSHAGHWRGALEVVADAKRWGAISMTRSGCPFTPHPNYQTPAKNRRCAAWFRAVRRWLAAHPTIHTVYIGGHALPDDAARRADYRRAWKSLPSSVRSVIVIRDTPRISRLQAGCVDRAVRRHGDPGAACAHPRGEDLGPDPQAEAARASGQRRVHVIDLTRFFCSASRCFPVVGGALVRKDTEHLTQPFSTSLGPYLLRASRRYLR